MSFAKFKISHFYFLIVFTAGCNSSNTQPVKTLPVIVREKEYEEPACDTCAIITTARADRSDIMCPACGHIRNELVPVEVCLIKYTCTTCKTDIYPKEGDCCVFCSYGTVKCPSKQ